VNQLTEVSPGIFLVRTVSQKKGMLELRELTLAIKTPNGLLLVDGCSHAGIEVILAAASAVDPQTENCVWWVALGDDADGRDWCAGGEF
jgi:7,8-dihydropterin-6-yl-methyl-4-(beta-D-ribofuranosyl)aminobenzene 5'-phosphate synthase